MLIEFLLVALLIADGVGRRRGTRQRRTRSRGDPRTSGARRDRPRWSGPSGRGGLDARAQGPHGRVVDGVHRVARRLRHSGRGLRNPHLEPVGAHRQAGGVLQRRRLLHAVDDRPRSHDRIGLREREVPSDVATRHHLA